MPRRLEVRLLGTFAWYLDGVSLPVPPSKHARILLARLMRVHPVPLRRRQVSAELFPGIPPARAQSRVRTALAVLRRALGPVLHATESTIALDPTLTVEDDASAFEQGTAPGRSKAELLAALALYHGPMLGGAGDGWAASFAQSLHARYLDALQRLARQVQPGTNPQLALQIAERWVSANPHDPAAHQTLVAARIAVGDQAGAKVAIAEARRAIAAARGRAQPTLLTLGMQTDTPVEADLTGTPHEVTPADVIARHIEQGRLLREQGLPARAEPLLRQAITDAGAANLPGYDAQAHVWLAYVLDDQLAAPAAVMDAFQQAHTAACRAGEPSTVLRAQLGITYAQMRMGQADVAEHTLHALLGDPPVDIEPWHRGVALRYLSFIQYTLGQYATALANIRESIAILDAAGEQFQARMSRGNLLNLLIGLGHYDEALLIGEINIAEARQQSNHVLLWEQLLSASFAVAFKGDGQYAWELLQESLHLAEAHGTAGNLIPILSFMVIVAEQTGRDAEARTVLDRLQRVGRTSDQTKLRTNIPVGPLFRRGDQARAIRIARSRLADVMAFPAGELLPIWAVHGLWDAAAVLAAAGDLAASQHVFEQAYARMLDDLVMLATPPMRQAYCQSTPAHRALMAFESSGPRILVQLPLRSAPTGRPLAADEWVPVVWTRYAPHDSGSAKQRRQGHLQRVVAQAETQGAIATVEALADVLGAGTRTIQRDLQALRDGGIRLETRGNRAS